MFSSPFMADMDPLSASSLAAESVEGREGGSARFGEHLWVALVLLAGCGSGPAPPPPGPPSWLPHVNGAALPLGPHLPRVEVEPPSVRVVDLDGRRRDAAGVEPAMATAAHDGSVVVAVRGEAAASTVWPALPSALATSDIGSVHFLVSQGGEPALVTIHPRRDPVEEQELGLSLALTSAGTRVFGSGGFLEPGCRTVSGEAVTTIPAGPGEPSRLRRCLRRVLEEFTDETTLWVHVDPDVSMRRVLVLLSIAAENGWTEAIYGSARAMTAGPGPDDRVALSPRAPGLTFEAPSTLASGRFDMSLLTDAVREHEPTIRRCFEHLSVHDSIPPGRVVVGFTVRSDGSIGDTVALEGGTYGACVAERMGRIRLSRGPDEPLRVTLPMVFEPGL